MVGRVDVNHIFPPKPPHVFGWGVVQALFRAHMTSPQTVSIGTITKLVMDVVDVDLPGGNYSSANRQWTPFAGTVHIAANAVATTFTPTDTYALRIYKNLVITDANIIAQDVLKVAGSFMEASCNVFDQASGADIYGVYLMNASANSTNVVLNQFQGNTFWSGAQWPGP